MSSHFTIPEFTDFFDEIFVKTNISDVPEKGYVETDMGE